MENENISRKLLWLISLDIDNEKEIIRKMDTYPNLRELVNIVSTGNDNPYNESMLMWAVWRLKPLVVAELIKADANVRYETDSMESVATYWNHTAISKNTDNMKKACNIAGMLHEAGVDFRYGSLESWSLIKRANYYNLVELQETLRSLDYIVSKKTIHS